MFFNQTQIGAILQFPLHTHCLGVKLPNAPLGNLETVISPQTLNVDSFPILEILAILIKLRTVYTLYIIFGVKRKKQLFSSLLGLKDSKQQRSRMQSHRCFINPNNIFLIYIIIIGTSSSVEYKRIKILWSHGKQTTTNLLKH